MYVFWRKDKDVTMGNKRTGLKGMCTCIVRVDFSGAFGSFAGMFQSIVQSKQQAKQHFTVGQP